MSKAKQIQSLTDAQRARFPEFIRRWTDVGLCTDPADRPRAEAAIARMYAQASLTAPRIVWCGSPLSQGLTRATVAELAKRAPATRVRDSVGDSVRDSVWASVRDSVWASVRDSVGASVWASVRDSVWASVRDSVGASVWASVRDSVWASVRDSVGASVWASVRDSVRDSVWASVRDSVWASVRDSVRDSVWDSVGDSVYGSHDANWLGFYEYFREVLGLTAATEPLGGLTELAHCAGWALPHAGLCWVSERHTTLRRNERGRLHSTEGAAVAYPDGWEIYAVDGVRVPGESITDRASLTPEKALGQSNTELRRAAVELLGWVNILTALQCRVIDTDANPQIGQLLEVDLPQAPRSRFIKVECGTKRSFALPVPPQMATAREANAWTYGLSKEELQLEART